MKHQVNVYYMYCPKELHAKEYHKYQRMLADKILNYGLEDMFQVDGTSKNIQKGKHGKPYLQGMEQYQYNISNTDGMVVCALSDVDVGVDVEKIKPFREVILKKCASPQETAYIMETEDTKQERFFCVWTLKESYIKMTGEGMRIPLQEVEFRFPGYEEVRCTKAGNFYQMRQGTYWLSVCVKEPAKVNWIHLEDI